MKKKLYKVSFFLLLIALFTFLECQIREEEKEIQQTNKEPVAHIAVGRWSDVKNSCIYRYILNSFRNSFYSSLFKYTWLWRKREGWGMNNDSILKAMSIPYKTFSDMIRISNYYEDKGFKVEIMDDIEVVYIEQTRRVKDGKIFKKKYRRRN